MKKPIKELETRVGRTYRGGKLLDEFLGKENPRDTFEPEDWISSFVEAKNKYYVKNEGITRVEGGRLITEVADASDFGRGRQVPGVLVKLLDSSERLGIQVHPSDEFAEKFFGSKYGKTECWHILNTRNIGDAKPVVYLGFQKWVTRDIWRKLFERQDVEGMLAAMYSFEVKAGDTILVKSGMPHAIGSGCFLLEIQQPSDYTLRAETTTVAGTKLTPQQVHYGIGEEHMLECFDYTPRSRQEVMESFFLKHPKERKNSYTKTRLVTYDDTEHFKLTRIEGAEFVFCYDFFVTILVRKDGGTISSEQMCEELKQGDKYFIPCNVKVSLRKCDVLISYPPRKEGSLYD